MLFKCVLRNGLNFLPKKFARIISVVSPCSIIHNNCISIRGLSSFANNAAMPVQSLLPPVYLKDVYVHDYLLKEFSENERTIAFINSETKRQYSYGEVYEKCHLLAQGLHQDGLEKGDIVTLCLPNSPEYAVSLLGILLRGGVVSGVNPDYTEAELENHLRTSKSSYVFIQNDSLQKLLNAATHLQHQIKKIYVIDGYDKYMAPYNKISTYENLLNNSKSVNVPPVKLLTKTDLAFLPFSSGTTGLPKGIMLSHYNVGSLLQIINQPTWYHLPIKDDHIVTTSPFYHAFGLIQLFLSMKNGVTLLTMPKFNRETFLRLIQEYKVPIIYTVPPILVFLAKDGLVRKYDLSSVRQALCGAAPLGKELCEELEQKFPHMKLYQGYGMTEMSGVSHLMPNVNSEPRHGSVGMLLSNFESKIVDVSTGEDLGPNKSGELCVRSVTCMLGYFNNQKATDEIYDKDRWLHSGDIGYYDKDGYFYIVDRLKELIKVRGFQVAPAEIEDLLLSCEGVKDAAVIGIPDQLSGEVPRAFVVLESGSRLTERQIMDFVNSKVTQYKRLKGGVEFLDEIPKAPSGKILRRILKARLTPKERSVSKL